MPDSHVALGLQCCVFFEVGQSAWTRARGRACFPSMVLWAVDWAGWYSWRRVASRGGAQGHPCSSRRARFVFPLSAFLCSPRTGAMQLVRAFQSTHSCNPFCPSARSCAQLIVLFLHRLCFHVHPCSLSSCALVLRRCAGRVCRRRRAFHPSAPPAQPEPVLKARAFRPRQPCRPGRRRSSRRRGRRATSGCKVLQRP